MNDAHPDFAAEYVPEPKAGSDFWVGFAAASLTWGFWAAVAVGLWRALA